MYIFNASLPVFFVFLCNKQNIQEIGCVRLPEWTELPEWTTGMDFYMWLLVLLMHFIFTE